MLLNYISNLDKDYLSFHRVLFKKWQVLLAAGDTFRAAASDQLEIWAQRTGCEIVIAGNENAKAATGNRVPVYS